MKKNDEELDYSDLEALGRPLLVIPRDEDEEEENPELEREFEESNKRVQDYLQRRERAVRAMAEVWSNAFLSGGEEAAKKAVEEHLRQVEANKTEEEREEYRIIAEREARMKPSVFDDPNWRDESPTSPPPTSGENKT